MLGEIERVPEVQKNRGKAVWKREAGGGTVLDVETFYGRLRQ